MTSSGILDPIRQVFVFGSLIISTFSSWIYRLFFKTRKIAQVEGFVGPGFEGVRDAFRENLESGWEPDGAALTVYHKGKLVVDLWGGYSDKESRRLWKQDSLAVIFSATKAVSALCVGILVDRGFLKYEDKVVSFWPEFGKHGKEGITVQWILSHMAGLAYTDFPITLEAALDWRKMSEIFENETPKWEPGSAVGYHAINYGWLVDQMIRRVDPKKRSLGQFFREELQEPFNLDLHIGLPPSEAHRVARIRLPSLSQRISEYLHNPSAVNYPRFLYDFASDGLLSKVERNPDWLRFVMEMTLNNPEYYALEQGALMGIGTARSLSKLFSLGFVEKKIFKNQRTLQKILTPYTSGEDIVTGANVSRGQGFMFTDFVLDSGVKNRMIGHAGYGGQNIKFDIVKEISFAYVSNGLKGGFGDSARTFVKLRNAIYQSQF
ncbi:hypothetical protein FO519_004932 [Halicephalobus sp. NKZ332]|nr:hypothetical protein FO519_004932 [Halicephalobus sp. NKZ332]